MKKNLYVVVLLDFFLFVFSLYFGFLLRFDFDIPEAQFLLLKKIVIPVVVTKFACFGFLGLYRGMWRFVSIGDCFNIIKASLLSTFVIITYILTVYRFEAFSRTVIINDLVITILLISIFRVCIRFYFELFSEHKSVTSAIKSILPFVNKRREGLKNLLIIGAGNSGETIYREIRNNNRLHYRVIGFLDDHKTKVGKSSMA